MSDTDNNKSQTQPQVLTPSCVTLFGSGGSGKTVTALLLAIGLSKHSNHAPIAFVDPEHVEPFARPMCHREGVPLFLEPSRSFVDMRSALDAAVAAKCCAFVVDHYDGINRELVEAQKTTLNLQGRRLPYHHREELIRVWEEWVDQFRAAPLTCIFTGRRAWEWGDDEDESGDPIKVKLGTKARGDADAEYEPNLLIEMERVERFVRDKQTRSRKGAIKHVARILKDRGLVLNGLSFSWDDLNGYKQGDYGEVWKALASHFTPVDAGERRLLRPEGTQRASLGVFAAPSGESPFALYQKRRTIAVEELQGAINTIWPGTTNDEKKLKHIVLETLFKSRSWTAIESLTPEELESRLAVMRLFEEAARDRDEPIDVLNQSIVIDLIQSCKDLESARAEAVSIL